MILVSLGNLGDLLIQAAFLRTLDRPDVSIAVPASYATIAAELFPRASVITLDDRLSDGRALAQAQIDRATAIAAITSDLQQRNPGVPVKSIALTDDVILKRSLNLYAAYWEIFQRDTELAAAAGSYPNTTREWVPFAHLPSWKQDCVTRTVYFCPWGGMPVKNIPAGDLAKLKHSIARQGFETRLLASSRDEVSTYESFPNDQVVRLADAEMIRSAAAHFARAALVVAVDTAWYHLAAMVGAPVLGIPGPRSLAHFEYPGSKRATSAGERPKDCIDCFSTDRCLLNYPACEAKPSLDQVNDAMLANLGVRRSFWQRAFARF